MTLSAQIMAGVCLVLLPLAFLFLKMVQSETYKRGKADQLNEDMKDVMDDIHLVKNARDRLRVVNADEQRLRDKYTRK